MDRPNLCSACDPNYVGHDDGASCEAGCYQCSGTEAECDTAVSNLTMEACPTIGNNNNCWVRRIIDGSTITIKRGCYDAANYTCTNDHLDKEHCVWNSVTKIMECGLCCTTAACNSQVLTGAAAALAFSFTALLAVAYAVLQQLA